MMSEENADRQEGQQSLPETPDYASMDIDEIEKRLASGEGLLPEEEEQPVPVEEPVSEDVPVDEPKEAEPVEQAADEQEQLPEPQPEVEQAEPQVDETQLQRDEFDLKVRQMENERKKLEFIASRNAGEAGYLKQQLDALTKAQPARVESEYDQPDLQQTATDPRLLARLQELEQRDQEREQEARAQAATDEFQSFVSETFNEGDPRDEVLGQMAEPFKKHFEPYNGMNLNPKAMRKITRIALDSAYAEVQLHRITEMRKQALERKAEQVDKSKQSKLKASISGSGSAPAPKSQPKRIEDMTAEEADKELIRQYGDGSRASRLRNAARR